MGLLEVRPSRLALVCWLALVGSCSGRPILSPAAAFAPEPPRWCVDILYSPDTGPDGVGRACMPKVKACEVVRSGLGRYGHLAGVRAVSVCFSVD